MGQDEIGSDQMSQIIKRKRTKRRKLSSTVLVTATTVTSTSSSACGSGEKEVSYEFSSPVSSEEEEEEDMEICLIMLDLKNPKISPENYVYECKTCNRTFSSFQALGGHRASHKKPKTSTEEKTVLPLVQLKSEKGQNSHFKVAGLVSNNMISKANKVHECSICGSDFTSGQALGGHMRRHRQVTAVVRGNSTEKEMENLSRSMEERKYLPLDLNLPAPEDDPRDSKFQGIVFSATPALIDCHY